MKTDLTTAIISAVVGVIIAYAITGNLLIKPPSPVSIRQLDNSVTSTLNDPDPEIFNYRALNPTVEVYIDNNNYEVVATTKFSAEEN